MNKKLARISQRREQLIVQAAGQRAALAHQIEPLRSTLSLVDRAVSIVHYVKQHPAIAIGATALLGTLRLNRAGKWLQRGWGAFLVTRNLRNWLLKS